MFFSRFEYYVLHFISICDLFTKSLILSSVNEGMKNYGVARKFGIML
jgi:hypothetical protein